MAIDIALSEFSHRELLSGGFHHWALCATCYIVTADNRNLGSICSRFRHPASSTQTWPGLVEAEELSMGTKLHFRCSMKQYQRGQAAD